MIKGTKEELDKLASTHKCPEHDNPLVVAWHAGENSYVLRCGAGHFPEEVTRIPTLTQLHNQGVELPEPLQSNVARSVAKRQQRTVLNPEAVTMGGVPAADLGTGELLPIGMIKALVEYALKYHLDPTRGHVMLMYGKPYIGIDGYLYHARRSGKPFMLNSRPLDIDEKPTHQLAAADIAWKAEVSFPGTGVCFNGIGIVTEAEMTAKSPRDATKLRSPVVAAHPWQLAQKRAEWQALRRAFPIGETTDKEED